MTDWKKIRNEFETTSITMKDLAEKHDVKYSTLRSRKSRENWQQHDATNVATDDATKKRGAPKGNKNAKGNSGGAAPRGNKNATGNDGGAPENNKNAVSHGLFADWLPEDALEIIREVSQKTPADMIWDNILIQYTAIIRSQKIMHVQHQMDSSSELQGAKYEYTSGADGNMIRIPIEESYNHQYAWDKQEKYLSAQSRAMGTLSNLIKQFVALADEEDKRKQELTLMTTQIEKLSLEVKLAEQKANEVTSSNDFTLEIVDEWSGGDD